MKIFNAISKLFENKKLLVPRTFAKIRWKQEIIARGLCMGGSFAREIAVVSDGTVVEIHQYSEPMIEYLESQMIPVVDETEGMQYPEQFTNSPETVIDLGRIELKRR